MASVTSGVELRFRGRTWVFGDEVNTDDMFPGFAMKLPIPEAAKHMFDATRPDWPRLVRAGDIVVGGRNFGIGSSRPVPMLFKELGVACIIAEEFNSLFLRNCINYGLPALAVPGIRAKVVEGQEIRVEIVDASVENIATGDKIQAGKYPDFIIDILRHGGVLSRLEKDGLLERTASGG